MPSIVSWPAEFPQGQVRRQLATGCDWLPTIAAACGAEVGSQKLDGRDLRQVISNADAASPHHSFYWRLGRGPKAQWVVREGDWKLLGNPRDTRKKATLNADDRLFLVNLAEDLSETKNLAKAQPNVVARLLVLQRKYEQGLNR